MSEAPASNPSAPGGREAVIVGGARTAIGRLPPRSPGSPARSSAASRSRAALERAGISGDQVGYVIMGQVLQAGAGQIPARQAAVAGGYPDDGAGADRQQGLPVRPERDRAGVPAHPAGRVRHRCRRGHGVHDAGAAPAAEVARRIQVRPGRAARLDGVDGLTDPFDHVSMGESTERHGARLAHAGEQDASRRDPQARRRDQEWPRRRRDVGVEVQRRRGAADLREDGASAPTPPRSRCAGSARPSPPTGRTAGSASQISDGACAVIVMARATAEALGGPLWPGSVPGHVAGPDNTLHGQSNAIRQALAKGGLTVADLDLIEINEAFAAVAIQSMRDLGVGPERVNINGGAIALGHPIGASGARIALHLVYELTRRGGGLGAAGLCGGGGQGEALILHVPAPAA